MFFPRCFLKNENEKVVNQKKNYIEKHLSLISRNSSHSTTEQLHNKIHGNVKKNNNNSMDIPLTKSTCGAKCQLEPNRVVLSNSYCPYQIWAFE
jgi:hypothetical protein